MAYFRKLTSKIEKILSLLHKEDRWLIVINADPDALASAMALKRILSRRVLSVDIGRVNEITRPDNITMARMLRIPTKKMTPALIEKYNKFAIVDSQPHHHVGFANISFSIVIDHHPISPEFDSSSVPFAEILPKYGAASSIMTEYLYNMGIRPGILLATALVYGIKTDTKSYERRFIDEDLKAFRYLNKFFSPPLLTKIVRSEFKKEWLPSFAKAIRRIRYSDSGVWVFMGEVQSADLLVILADFFLRVQDMSRVIISGTSEDTLICVFRGDGLRQDMGKLANSMFGQIGSAGGHRQVARAEIPLAKLKGQNLESFVMEALQNAKKKHQNHEQKDELTQIGEQD